MSRVALALLFSITGGCGAGSVLADGDAGVVGDGGASIIDARPSPLPTGDGGVPPMSIACQHTGSGTDYRVGPGQPYASLGAVPFEALQAGDTVRVFHRDTPYREKLMLSGQGTADQPIRLCGVPGPAGELPVIDGQNATTRATLDFPFDGHQVRGLVIVGHPNGDPYLLHPRHIVIEGFEITNATPPYTFTSRNGSVRAYSTNAAAIFIERGHDITIRGNLIHTNNNGIFAGTGGGEIIVKDLLLEGNYIHGNGSPEHFQHNVYNEVENVTYQFNRFGPALDNRGNAIKERSAGVVIRYNWIEDGAHLIDLVDAQEAKATTVGLPSFHETYVYGNVLVRRANTSAALVHYGGDSGVRADYRKGTLHFFANTVIVHNAGMDDYDHRGIFELSTNDERLDARNNVFYSTTGTTELRPVIFLGHRDRVASGVATFAGNWVRSGWMVFPPSWTQVNLVASESGFATSLRAAEPGFISFPGEDLAPMAGATIVGMGVSLADLPPVDLQYVRHQGGEPRADGATPTIGAFAP